MWFLPVVAFATEPSCPEPAPRRPPIGWVAERSAEGDLLAMGSRRRGERHGVWCRYAPYGGLVEEETLDRGVREGPYFAWGAYGARVIGAYAEGLREGPWWEYDPAGGLVEHGAYAADARVGPWFERGAEGAYVAGQRDGVWTFPDPRREVTYRLGVPHGPTREWDAAGVLVREETYADGVVSGAVRFVEGGVETRGEIRDGQRVGEWTVTDASGVVEHGVYVAGLRHGAWESREDGARVERTWDHGVLHGPVRVWRGGVLVQEAGYRADQPHGTWTYYASGLPERRLTYADGVLEGPFTVWDASGAVVEEGAFVAGQRSGPWRQVASGGVWTGAYVLGAKEGVWRFALDGVVQQEIGWSLDRQHGVERAWSGGVLRSECGWREGLRHGTCAQWAADGTPTSLVTWDSGQERGPFTTWHDNGTRSVEGTYADGQPDGPWTSWHDDGRVAARGSFAVGVPVGAWEYRHASGVVERAGSYDADGLEIGVWTERYPDGTTCTRGAYEAGVRTGEWSWWYPSGQLERRGAYAAGQRTGEWTFWYPNGVVMKEGPYVEGARNGRWTFRNRTGSTRGAADFVMGTLHTLDPRWPVAGELDPMPDPEDVVVLPSKDPFWHPREEPGWLPGLKADVMVR